MTVVQLDISRDIPGGFADVTGSLIFAPSRRRTEDTTVVLPQGFTVQLTDATVDVAPTAPGWCWKVTEGTNEGASRFLLVPDSTEPVPYSSLIEVDPATLDPMLKPEPAWWAALAQIPVLATQDTGLQRLASVLTQGSGTATVAILTDSTGDEGPEWFIKGLKRLATSRPWLKFLRYAWADATASPWADPTSGGYGAVITEQVGTAPLERGRIWRDNFARSGEVVGAASTPAQAAINWGGATGLWAADGGELDVVAAGSGINVPLTATSPRRVLGFSLKLPTSTSSKTVTLSLGASLSNRVQVLVTAASGTVQWKLYKQIAGAGSGVTALSALTLADASYASFELEVNDNTVTARCGNQSITGTLAAGDVAALAGGSRVYVDTSGSPAGASLDDIWVDHVTTRDVPTLVAYNGGKSGSTLAYQRARLARVLPVEPDVVVISSSHNYTTTAAADYLMVVEETVAEVRQMWPGAAIVVSSQNPELPPVPKVQRDAHRDRLLALRPFARAKGWGYVGALERFTADGPTGLRIRADGLHPTGDNAGYDGAPDPTNGSYLWSDTWLEYLSSVGIEA